MASRRDKPFLPSELITNILKRLPIKSIVRFQCVCKQWKNLLKTQSFIYEHYHFHSAHKKNPLLLHHQYRRRYSLSLLNHDMETAESLSIPSIDSFRHSWRIIGSCNGLLCVVRDVRGESPSSIWLWNPVIREVREIPLTTLHYSRFCAYGFGFSSIANDYKIVRFYNQEWRKNKEDQLEHLSFYDGVEVFSLSTGSWKELEFEFEAFRGCRRFTFEPVNVDGTIFWLAEGHISPIIVSFNVATEAFTSTPIAMFTSEPTDHRQLVVYDNKLEVHSVNIEFPGHLFLSVWVMEEVASESGKSLIPAKKYRVGPISKMLFPQCIWKNEIACISGEVGGGLTLFNLITKERRDFNFSNASTLFGVYNYEKSLVSVWNNNQVE